MRVVSCLFILIFFVSCNPTYLDNPSPATKQSLATEVRNQTILQLNKEKELYPCGIGAGMLNQIRMLALSFHYYKEVNIEQARELLLSAGTIFLENINNNERIHPFLQNYPFMPENIEIRIFLRESDGSKRGLDKLSVVSMIDGILEYDIRSSETNRLKTIYKENYSEAVAKLNKVAGF